MFFFFFLKKEQNKNYFSLQFSFLKQPRVDQLKQFCLHACVQTSSTYDGAWYVALHRELIMN